MKRSFVTRLFIFVVVLLSVGIHTVADETDIMLFSDEIVQGCGISLSKNSTTISVKFKADGKQTMSVIGAPTYDVQRYVDGAWKTIESGLSGKTGTNRVSYSFSKNYTGVSGGKYRFKGYFFFQTPAGATRTVKYTSASITL